jgi:nicotinamide riboside transporter PnuC
MILLKRKSKPNLWSDVCILIIAVLAITAFIRGTWQFWLLIAAFTVWSIYASFRHLFPFIREQRDRREARELRRYYEQRKASSRVYRISTSLTLYLLFCYGMPATGSPLV